MFEGLGLLLDSAAFYLIFCSTTALYTIYLAFSQFCLPEMDSNRPQIFYQKGSKYMERVLEKCSTLREGYQPASLWGKNGHVQTALFGTVGRRSVPELVQERFSVLAPDGSTLHYDVFEPEGDGDVAYTVFIVPGINNSSENSYVRAFAYFCIERGYRAVVYNHLGALKSEKLTGHRIFTYGGTEDMALVYDDLCGRYPHTEFMGCGYSLGACVLVRFLGEKRERRKRFVFATSFCQGYDPSLYIDRVNDWRNMRKLYNFQITKFHKNLIFRHKHMLFPPESLSQDTPTQQPSTDTDTSKLLDKKTEEDALELPELYFHGFPTEITHDAHNSNGCSLDRRKCRLPNIRGVWSSSTLPELDEAYTCRMLGFGSVEEMYRWVSCVELLNQIDDLPMLMLNSMDDPCVIEESHNFPRNFAENQSKSLFVLTRYGGHLGYYEGGVVPKRVTWMDRLFEEFARGCIEANQDSKLDHTYS